MNKLLSCRQGRRRHHLCKQRGVHPVRGGAVSHPAPSSGAHRSFDQSRSEINAPARSAQSKKSHARPSLLPSCKLFILAHKNLFFRLQILTFFLFPLKRRKEN